MFELIRSRLLYCWLELIKPLQDADFQTIESERVVFLVSGFGASSGSMRALKKYLEEQGYAVRLFGKKKQFKSPEKYAAKLQKEIQACPAKDIAIFAHSMGGMIAVLALADPTTLAKVRRVVTSATPWQGCWQGTIFVWSAARACLRRDPAANWDISDDLKAKMRVLIPRWDDIIWERARQELPGVDTTILPCGGHVLLTYRPAYSHILKALR